MVHVEERLLADQALSGMPGPYRLPYAVYGDREAGHALAMDRLDLEMKHRRTTEALVRLGRDLGAARARAEEVHRGTVSMAAAASAAAVAHW